MERLLKQRLRDGKFDGLTAKHSRKMSAVRGKRNKTTELALQMALVRAGISGWTLHEKMPGRPDFYFPAEKLAVFVDGCFWHGCERCGHIPSRNRAYWSEKLVRNRLRDESTTKRLRSEGVRVIRFWEHELKDSKLCLQKLKSSKQNPL